MTSQRLLQPPAGPSMRDDLLQGRIARKLNSWGYKPLRCVCVEVHGGRARLAGRLPSYYLKQLAQCAAMSVPGVHEIENEIVVG